jgi:hypothetical protein
MDWLGQLPSGHYTATGTNVRAGRAADSSSFQNIVAVRHVGCPVVFDLNAMKACPPHSATGLEIIGSFLRTPKGLTRKVWREIMHICAQVAPRDASRSIRCPSYSVLAALPNLTSVNCR